MPTHRKTCLKQLSEQTSLCRATVKMFDPVLSGQISLLRRTAVDVGPEL